MSEISIGSTYVGMKALSAMTTPVKAPGEVKYQPYATVVTTGDGAQRGIGLPMCTLYWRAITRSQRDQLRTFCTGASAPVFVSLPTNDSNNTYATYTGVMVWPLGETYNRAATGEDIINDLQITIRQLVPYTP